MCPVGRQPIDGTNVRTLPSCAVSKRWVWLTGWQAALGSSTVPPRTRAVQAHKTHVLPRPCRIFWETYEVGQVLGGPWRGMTPWTIADAGPIAIGCDG